MNSAQRMHLVTAAVGGLKALKGDEGQKALDSVISMLREIANDPDASEDDKGAAVRMLKAVSQASRTTRAARRKTRRR